MLVSQSERQSNSTGASHPHCASSTGRHRRRQHLTDVASAAAGQFWIISGRRPQREVVGKGSQRSHVHEIVPQQPITSTQRLVDLRQEEVSAVDGESQSFYHVVNFQTIGWRVVVAADTEYVSTQSCTLTRYNTIFYYIITKLLCVVCLCQSGLLQWGSAQHTSTAVNLFKPRTELLGLCHLLSNPTSIGASTLNVSTNRSPLNDGDISI